MPTTRRPTQKVSVRPQPHNKGREGQQGQLCGHARREGCGSLTGTPCGWGGISRAEAGAGVPLVISQPAARTPRSLATALPREPPQVHPCDGPSTTVGFTVDSFTLFGPPFRGALHSSLEVLVCYRTLVLRFSLGGYLPPVHPTLLSRATPQNQPRGGVPGRR